jgi:hypothetical protein
MDLRNAIRLPGRIFRNLGNGALRLWAGSKEVSPARRARLPCRLIPAARSGIWSDFNRANALRGRNASILRNVPADGHSREPIDFRQWKIPIGLFFLFVALSAAYVCGITVAHRISHPVTALPSTPETKLPKRVHGDSAWQRVSALRQPRLLPIQVLPDPVITPGEAQNISLAEVRKMGSSGSHLSSIPPEVKRSVFLAYGLSPDEKNYELDHLIPLSLGGSNSAKNLWPHSRKGSFWTIDKKLTLEKRVYRLVCAGRLSLVSAREFVASDWPKAYRKYVDKTAPILPEHSPEKLSTR